MVIEAQKYADWALLTAEISEVLILNPKPRMKMKIHRNALIIVARNGISRQSEMTQKVFNTLNFRALITFFLSDFQCFEF